MESPAVSPAGEGRRPQSQHERFRAVGQAHSTREAIEQGFFNRGYPGHGPVEMVEERGLTKGNLFEVGGDEDAPPVRHEHKLTDFKAIHCH